MGTQVGQPRRSDCTVMASVDEDGAGRRLIIADVDRDDAWLAMRMDEACAVRQWA